MCVCVSVCVCMSVCMYVCPYVCINICVYVFVRVCPFRCSCIHPEGKGSIPIKLQSCSIFEISILNITLIRLTLPIFIYVNCSDYFSTLHFIS